MIEPSRLRVAKSYEAGALRRKSSLSGWNGQGAVGGSDPYVVAKSTQLSGESFGALDKNDRLDFNALLDIADSLMENLPNKAA